MVEYTDIQVRVSCSQCSATDDLAVKGINE